MLADEGVRLPGVRRAELARAAHANGIAIAQPLADQLRALAQ